MSNAPSSRSRRRGGNELKVTVRSLVILGLTGLVVLAGFSSIFRVDASDQAVVLRFGRHVRTVEPGLHFKLPYPVEEVHAVPVQRIQSLEFGFVTERPGRKTIYRPKTQQDKEVAEMLTGDLNLAHVEWIVQYRVSDPYKALFRIGGVDGMMWDSLSSSSASFNLAVPDTVSDISESVVRKLVGDISVDAVLTIGREQLASDAKAEIQKMLDEFEAGVEVVTVKLQTTDPPEAVRDAFQEVNRARQNKERVVNEAEGERNRQIPAARGRRDQTISEAEGYAQRVVLETQGRTEAFEAQLAEYEKSPEITRQRLYLEAMQEVLNNVGDKTIIDQSVQGVLPLMNLDAGRSGFPSTGGSSQP